MDKPHPTNFCGGNYANWLEVLLTPKCNAKCSWCIERKGWHPKEKASTKELIDAILATGKTDIMLLGGEPTLHKDLGWIITELGQAGKRVYLTTNGSNLTDRFCTHTLYWLHGLNVSIHHFDLKKNAAITGIHLREDTLKEALGSMGDKQHIRFNCNLIRGAIDNSLMVERYIHWAKQFYVENVRFAELKADDEQFVDATKINIFKPYLLNDHDPYKDGCGINMGIRDMAVNLRLMCGLQTNQRPAPACPKIIPKQVLYYDGKLYDGWQQKGNDTMEAEKVLQILSALEHYKKDTCSVTEALKVIMETMGETMFAESPAKKTPRSTDGGSCQY